MYRFVSTLALVLGAASVQAAEPIRVRLYALDCGYLEFDDLAPFSDTGEYDGQAGRLIASCFLVRHPAGDLLWDAGLGDRHSKPVAGTRLPYLAVVQATLQSQLRAVGMDYTDIEYFAFSHGHPDHLGNANALAGATWIVNRHEWEWLHRTPAPPRTDVALVAAGERAQRRPIDGDHDVFGDGTVRILATPGHTPGHQVLMVKLRSGAVVLSGDLYHSRENRNGRRMPVFNNSRADTLASIDRIEKILANTGARLVIQHSADDVGSLPRVPAAME